MLGLRSKAAAPSGWKRAPYPSRFGPPGKSSRPANGSEVVSGKRARRKKRLLRGYPAIERPFAGTSRYDCSVVLCGTVEAVRRKSRNPWPPHRAPIGSRRSRGASRSPSSARSARLSRARRPPKTTCSGASRVRARATSSASQDGACAPEPRARPRAARRRVARRTGVPRAVRAPGAPARRAAALPSPILRRAARTTHPRRAVEAELSVVAALQTPAAF